jgi:lipopolysaccharide export system ATP-binding protein
MTLVASQLKKSYGQRVVVHSASFRVSRGEVVGLLGPNGAGKTTSFYMMVGLVAPSAGTVTLDGEDITHLAMHQRVRKGVGYLPQNVSIFRKLSVYENLLSVFEFSSIPPKKQKNAAEDLMEKFRISHIAQSLGASLSGGERRRVEIARSLIMNPHYLLLDEPFAGVDPVTVQEIQEIILSLKKEGMGVLVTDHNVRETLASCDRSYVLLAGEIIAEGTPDNVMNEPMVKKTYLGENFKI